MAENSYLRRLHRILSLPTPDWKDKRLTADDTIQIDIVGRSFANWIRTKLGFGTGIIQDGSKGIKSIRQKSLHFKS